ncbi:Fanconi anemia group F protein [Heterocephalus glaber]|uniref:Fanconi anemia group F protein n=1 Tax=Heterocephalus glaber TaxID=10181 RepID=G5AR29_HETGA|nr:Fanconi anemia group F protein [Heterocephalus glaber]EHA99489.1 Fanconi anemia group F protein [Heterocephalus glaber]
MEPLLQQLERFSEVLSVSGTAHVSTWGPETVRRALDWARYLRHVARRFGGHARIRSAVERRLRSLWGPEGRGLTSFQALGRGDVQLFLSLLRNRALGEAAGRALLLQLLPGAGPRDADAEELQARLARLARYRAALLLLREAGSPGGERPALAEDPVLLTQAQLLLGRLREAREAEAGDPGGWLGRVWTRAPRDHFLQVAAVALLQPLEKELGASGPETPGEESQLLVRWLLEQSEVLAAFCRHLPAELLTSVAGRHPALSRAYLGLLTDWGARLHYDLQKGTWVGAESQDVPWEELLLKFRSLWHAPPPLQEEVLAALESSRARGGDFEVPGLSVWTDLLLALRRGER